MGDVYFIIVPVVAIVVVLKVCLICCRVWLYQKRRQERAQIINQRRVALESGTTTARVIAVRRVQGPGGIAQQTSYAIEQPGCPTRQVTRTIIVRPASGRPNNPNLPPSYDQAVTGADHSVKVDDGEDSGRNPLLEPPPWVSDTPPAPPEPSAPLASETNLSLPHMPPPRNSTLLPPAYTPPTTGTLAPPTHYEDNEIDTTERQRLLA